MARIYSLITIIIFIASGNTAVFSQVDTSSVFYQIDKDKKRYEDILERETNALEEDSNARHKYFLIPDKLPEWFYHPSKYATSGKFMIGISDPGLDSVQGVESATLRAHAMLLLSQNARIENISDNFYVNREAGRSEKAGSQYLDFTRIHSENTFYPDSIQLNEVFRTKYNETIVLVSCLGEKKDSVEGMAVTAELMQLAREDEISLESTVFCKMTIHNYDIDDSTGIQQMHYTYKSRENKFDVISVIDADTIDYPVHPYRYYPSEDTLAYDSTDIRQDFYTGTGLWNAYINLLFSRMNYYNKYLSSRVKTTFDLYSMKNQGITRTVSRNLISFELGKLEMKDQQLGIDLRIYERSH